MTRSRDLLQTARPIGLNVTHPAPSRPGGILVWVLPALAALALATLWFATPSQPESVSSPVAASQIPAATGRPVSTGKPSPEPAANSSGPITSVEKTPRSHPLTKRSDPSLKHPQPLADAHSIVKGEWTSFYQGQRRLTVLDGGKATMVVEPEGLGAVLLAPKITFEVLWRINGNQLEFETVGGEPLDKVDVVVKMYGKHRKHKIVRLEPDQIVLLDEDGVTEYVWTRVAKADS